MDQAEPRAAVGVSFGCFHFPPRAKAGERFEGKTYPDAVTRALEESPGVENVSARRRDGSEFRWVLDGTRTPPKVSELGGPFPRAYSFELEFDLRIPKRMQQELLRRPVPSRDLLETERFHVRIRYGFEMPVAAIALLDTTTASRPSEAVVLIRRFLEREFARSQQQKIGFEFLGPSPAHCSFHLVPALPIDRDDEPFRRLHYRVSGYHHYTYGFDAEGFQTPQHIVDAFLWTALVEMSLLYRMAQEERARIRAWREIQMRVDQLVELQQLTGVRGFYERALRSSRRIGEAQMALIEFASREVSVGDEIERRLARVQREQRTCVAPELLQTRHDAQTTFPRHEVAELLRLFETRRMTDRDALMLGAASVLGGALGAVGGFLAG